jgi:predicted site-specific integrase-resolvase
MIHLTLVYFRYTGIMGKGAMSGKNMENEDVQRFVSTGQAEKTLGLCARTIRKYAKDGKIDYMLTEGGKFRFDVSGYIARKVNKAASAA